MIKIITVGKLKEPALSQLTALYLERLQPYHKVELIEVKDYPDYQQASLNKQSLAKEAKLILQLIKPQDYVVSLDIKAPQFSSEAFASKVAELLVISAGKLVLVIGSSLGLDTSVKKRAAFSLSLSELTFPHGLARLILLEQLYRSFKIINHEPYHK